MKLCKARILIATDHYLYNQVITKREEYPLFLSRKIRSMIFSAYKAIIIIVLIMVVQIKMREYLQLEKITTKKGTIRLETYRRIIIVPILQNKLLLLKMEIPPHIVDGIMSP